MGAVAPAARTGHSIPTAVIADANNSVQGQAADGDIRWRANTRDPGNHEGRFSVQHDR